MNTYNQPDLRRLPGAPGGLENALLQARPWEAPASPQPVKGLSYWQLAWGHKFLILGALLVGALAGMFYDVVKTPLYTSSTTVEVEQGERSIGLSQADSQANSGITDVATQMRVLVSRKILNQVVERMNLDLTPSTTAPTTFFTRLHNRLPLPFLQQEPLAQSRDAINMAAATVSVRALGATRLIEVSCKSSSPDVASNFLNILISENKSSFLLARATRSQRTSQWMDEQLEEAKSRLQKASEALRDFQRNSPDFVSDQNTLADSKLRTLQSELSTIQSDRIAKQARWELAKSTPAQNLPDVMRDGSLLGLKSQLDVLYRQKAQLMVRLTPEHDKVKSVDVQIAQTERALTSEEAAFLRRAEQDYQEALRREKLLSGAYGTQTRSVSNQADKAATFAMLKRDVELEQQLYLSLLKSSTETALMQYVPGGGVQQVDQAYPVNTPISPEPAADIPLGAALGGGLAYGIVWLVEMSRRKKLTNLFDAPGRAQLILGVPELGVIPSTQASQPKTRRRIGMPARRHEQLALPAEAEDTNGARPGADFWLKMDSSIVLSESFRQTLVSLLRNRPKDHSPIYVITSAGPGEGKTTLSANLARAMAEIGHRVLVVDADLRRPHLHSLLSSGDQPGLSDVLMGEAEISQCDLDSFIQPTSFANLSVMTHGRTQVDSPAVLFFSPKVGQLTARLRSRFDFVLFDTAPSLPFPDARLWGKYSDGVVLVVRAGVTTREGAAAVCQRLLADGVPVLGSILNDWTPRQPSKSSYYYSYDYYAKPRKS